MRLNSSIGTGRVADERVCRMYSDACQAAHARKVEVLQQRCGARQSPRGERGAAEFRGEPAAHPAVVRMHLPAQHQRSTQRKSDAGKFQPGQREQVQPVADDRRTDDGRDDVCDDRGDDEPPELRGALVRVVVAFLLEQVDGVRRLERILRPRGRRVRQPVKVGEHRIVGIEPVPVFLAHFVGRRIDDHHRLADRLGVLHDVGCAAPAPRGLSVPHGEQHIRPVDRLDAAIQIAVLAVAVLADRAHVIRSGQDVLHGRPVTGREVLGELGARQRQDRVPGEPDGARLLHEQLVAAACNRGQRDPLARDFPTQRIERPADRAGRARRIRQVPVAGEANDVKLRQFSGRGTGSWQVVGCWQRRLRWESAQGTAQFASAGDADAGGFIENSPSALKRCDPSLPLIL